jgi:hypothetical protein
MRFNDWQTRFTERLREIEQRPFEWGTHDCSLFPCDMIEAIIGIDPAAWFRGRYNDKVGAYKALREFAGGGLEQTAEKICNDMGFIENAPNFQQRGDVALCDQGGDDALGIIDLSGHYVIIAGEQGVVRKPMDCVKRSWRVE